MSLIVVHPFDQYRNAQAARTLAERHSFAEQTATLEYGDLAPVFSVAPPRFWKSFETAPQYRNAQAARTLDEHLVK